jgi:proteic killer suppression protein
MIHLACDRELSGQDHRSRLQRRKSEGLPSDLVKVARRKLRYLNAAGNLGDLRSPPGNHLEALAGDRKRATRDQDQRPIPGVLCVDGGRPGGGEIVDYH